MSIPSYLANIKSSGFYRFVWDKSQRDNPTAEILRLVVGYSNKGPFNTPVYVKNQTEFIRIFGGISRQLEKRGVYFHRNALQALERGPILALNLKKFTYGEGEDAKKYSYVKGITFNPVKDELIEAGGENPDEFKAFELKDLKIEDIYDTTRFWTLSPSAAVEAVDEKGNQILNKYVSVVAADSKDSSNTIFMCGYTDNRYDVTIKEWYSAVASEEMPAYFEGYEDMMVSDFLMKIYVFRGKFTKDVVATSNLKRYFDITDDGNVVLKPYIENSFGDKVNTLEALSEDDASNFINVYAGVTLPFFKDSRENYISLDLLFNADYSIHKMMMNFNSDLLDNGVYKTKGEDKPFTVDMISTTGAGSLEMLPGSPEKIGIINGIFNIPDGVTATISVGEWVETEGSPATGSFEFNTIEGDSASINFYKYSFGDGDTYVAAQGDSPAYLQSGNAQKWIASGLAVGDRVIAKDGRLSTISEVTVGYADGDEAEPTDVTIKFSRDIFGYEPDGIYLYSHTMGDINTNSEPIYIEGYTQMDSDMKPASLNQWDKLQWQKTILSALTDYEGIRIGLTNRKDVTWRYIVSTFEGLVEAECQATISLIAKENGDAFAFVNFPSVNTFKTCPYASFKDSNGRFQVKYIADGCNKQKPASVRFSLAGEGNGASFCSYNTPLVFSDGTVNTVVPAAALVSNLFMDKFTTRHVFDAVAGAKYGYITAPGLVGPDYNFSRADLDILEPMGVNAMVYEPLIGTYINSNQTAKQKPETALSKIHVRELTIFLQDEVENMMKAYHWDKNTASLRDTLKSRADKICETCVTNGGITKFENVCDTSNNTNEIIDNEMLVISVHIEPAMCAGKMVQELTLYKTGGLSSQIIE